MTDKDKEVSWLKRICEVATELCRMGKAYHINALRTFIPSEFHYVLDKLRPEPFDVNKLVKEYRPTMPTEVLHLWATDMINALNAAETKIQEIEWQRERAVDKLLAKVEDVGHRDGDIKELEATNAFNFEVLQTVTGWMIGRDIFEVTHHGDTADDAAANITDSIQKLITSRDDAVTHLEMSRQTFGKMKETCRLYHDRTVAAEAYATKARAVLEPFDEMYETSSRLADLHGENEFILSFGPAVVVGVLPFSAIHDVRLFMLAEPPKDTPPV